MSIWDFKEIKKQHTGEHITLDEGHTPVNTFEVQGINVFFKREDQNPTGSWKDRGTAYKISKIKNQHAKNAVVSSSGNAAISYLEYAQQYPDLEIDVIVSDSTIPSSKLETIEKLITGTHHTLHRTKHAKKLRAQLIAQKKAVSLSSATDDDVLKGYWSLGFELAELVNKTIQKKVPLFIQVSSGATLVGTVQGLSMRLKTDEWMPQIIVVQTETIHPIINIEEQNQTNVEMQDVASEGAKHNLADAITDRSCLRSPQINKIIAETSGTAYAITNDELEQAKKAVGIDLSYTSLLSIAGMLRFHQDNTVKQAICIASGR